MILDDIVAYKRRQVEEEKKRLSLNDMVSKIKMDKARDFNGAMENPTDLSIIAEVKKASPSKGIIKEDFDPVIIAGEYDKNNVGAISVLTENKFFLGKDQYLFQVKEITSVPVLRKDFIIDPYQIFQSKLLGADAILLITAILSKNELMDFQRIAKDMDLQCLVEVHDEAELQMALETQPMIIGINNRNLKTFKTSLKTTEKLIQMIPKDKTIISESGINTRWDMEFLKNLGVDGVLVGESLMRASSIDERIMELRGR